jgi:translation initiation factor IF-3
LAIARQQDLDLVEVADKASPPVCRIMDYGKYKYEAAQRAKESRKKASNISVKEMKYRPKIGTGDFDTKTRKVEQFLGEGHKVKVTIMFRGREVQHPELGRKILDHVAEAVAHVGLVEVYPKQDGRNMVMVLGPDKKAQAAAAKKKAAEGSESGSSPEPAADAPLADIAAADLAAEEIAIDEVSDDVSDAVAAAGEAAEPEPAESRAD